MSRNLNRLTGTKVKSLSDPERHSDSGNLYLRVRPSGTKNWIFN